jgi:hypothetical protein
MDNAAVSDAVGNNPYPSIRHTERYSEMSKTSINHICKCHPYHIPLNQALHGNNFQNCAQFCK